MPHRAVRFVAAAALATILAVFAQAVLDLPYHPRFDSPTANYWMVATLAALTPLFAYSVARTIPREWLRRLGVIGAVVLAVPCLLISSCAMIEAPQLFETDSSYELLSEAPTGRVVYRLYLTNCGATCAYGLELREERDLPFGAKLVTPRWSLYRASEGVVRVDESSVLVVNGDYVLGKVAR